MADRELGNGAANSRDGSNVDTKVPGEPLAFLQPETGDVIIVPGTDANLLRSHYNGLSEKVADLHSANKAVQLCEANLQDLQAQQGSDTDKALARRVLGFAIEWQVEAHGKLREVYDRLDPVPDSKGNAGAGQTSGSAAPAKPKEDKHSTAGVGNRLVELIALGKESAEAQQKKKADGQELQIDGLTLKKKMASFKSATELKKFAKWPKTMPEKLVYVESGKLKPAWPKIKDAEKTRWSEVYAKGSNGKRSLDKGKLRSYVKEQIANQTTIKPKTLFGEDLKGGASITLGQWADNWNQEHHLERRGSLSHGETKLADIELSADAQLMRFSYGGSLNGDLSVMDRRVSVKAEGHAAIDFAKAEANLDLYFPRKEGWLWTVQDRQGKSYDLIAARCRITLEVSGVVGASIAGELAMKVQVSPLDNKSPRVSGKPGRKGKKARGKRSVSINTNDEADVGALDVSVSAFAGARADAALTGALEWRDPESLDKAFVSIADIAPSAGGMAGIGAGAKFKIEYIDGTFRFTAHASLCVGLGAEGGIEFEVGVKQMALFFRCLFYNLAYWQFKNLEIISDDAFNALKWVQFLVVKSGKNIEHFYRNPIEKISESISEVKFEMKKAGARLSMAKRILGCKKDQLIYLTPESKGMLIYQLMQHSIADVVANGAAFGDNYLGPQREAVLWIIKAASSKAEADNVIQHIDVDGNKGVLADNLSELVKFFRKEGVGDFDIPFHESRYPGRFSEIYDKLAMNGNFEAWYRLFHDHLMNAVPHGHALADATSPEYEILRENNDHPLFASTGWKAYYTSEA